MKIIISLLFIGLFGFVNAQQSGGGDRPKIGTYTGKVVNGKNQSALPYTKIFLLSMRDSTLLAGGLSDVNGNFNIEDIPAGAYIAKFTSFGFKNLYIDSLFFMPRNSEINAGNVSMEEDVDLLSEVEVVSETNEIQTGIDKKIFNVEKQITAQGGTALDALQNVPSITVDMDGNVSLRGSANVTILIDGRPSSITGSGRQGALESIPASSIETIEIITNPSAKYDPDGMSGIINIVLKKNKMKGFNGNVDLGTGSGIDYVKGTQPDYNGSINLAYRTKSFNIYGGYSINNYAGYRNFNQTMVTNINDNYNICLSATFPKVFC